METASPSRPVPHPAPAADANRDAGRDSRLVFALNFPEKEEFFLAPHLREAGAGFVVVPELPSKGSRSRIRWARVGTAWRAIRASTSRDLLVAWCFDLGLIAAILCLASFRRRTIVAHNLILDTGLRPTPARRLKRAFIRTIFRTGRFHATVNSRDQIPRYARHFGVDPDRFHLVHDSFDTRYSRSDFTPGDGSVFSGGRAYRDWKSLAACATLLPQVRFVAVVPSEELRTGPLPANLEIHREIPEERFMELLAKSSLVCIPLAADCPAGLIVMVHASLHHRPTVCTRTGPTLEFTDEGRTGILVPPSDPAALAREVSGLLSDPDRRRELSELARLRLEAFSPASCAAAFLRLHARLADPG